jgi:hypothetical protein
MRRVGASTVPAADAHGRRDVQLGASPRRVTAITRDMRQQQMGVGHQQTIGQAERLLYQLAGLRFGHIEVGVQPAGLGLQQEQAQTLAGGLRPLGRRSLQLGKRHRARHGSLKLGKVITD